MSDPLPPLPGPPSSPPYGHAPPVDGMVGAADERTGETAPATRVGRASGWWPASSGDGAGRPVPGPTVVVASALLLGGLGVVLAVLVGMASAPVDVAVGRAGFFERVQAASAVLGLPAALLVPLSLLVRRVGPDGAPAGTSRALAVGAAAVGGALTFVALLAVVADLVGAVVVGPNRLSAVLVDLAVLAVAGAGAWWALAELDGGADRGPIDGSTLVGSGERQPGRIDWRPADPGWTARPPVWPEQPPLGGRERGPDQGR